MSSHIGSHGPKKITRAEASSEFSFESAMALQTEFFEAFSQDVFQQQLQAIMVKYDKNSAEFKKARYELILPFQQRILPKYGFEGSQRGVWTMVSVTMQYYNRKEFREIWIKNDLLLGLKMPNGGRDPEIVVRYHEGVKKFWYQRMLPTLGDELTELWSGGSKTNSAPKPTGRKKDALEDASDMMSKAPVAWRRGVLGFVDMLHDMQESNICGMLIMKKLTTLLMGSPDKDIYDTCGFCISEFMHDVLSGLYMPDDQSPTEALGNLLSNLEKRVAAATKHMDPACDWICNPDVLDEETLNLVTAITSGGHRFRGFDIGSRHILFIALPLSLYVRHNPHLYELLKRMRSLVGYALTEVSPQEALDSRGQPYSALAYAIMAALQMLHTEALEAIANDDIARGNELRALSPLQFEDRTTPSLNLPPSDEDCTTPSSKLAPSDTALMFRGIWVPRAIDEAKATYQWSFNSFSRCLEGVCHVLNFYAGVENSETWRLATQECHVLFLVARRAQSLKNSTKDWAFPVEFFNGLCGELEQELLVPPFATYTFEENCELSGSMPLEEQMSRVQRVEARWSMKPGGLLESAPLLRDLLDGYAEPLRHTLDKDGWTPNVTVRFIKCIRMADPIQELFAGSSCSLLEFPDASRGRCAESEVLRRSCVQQQWLEVTECLAMREADYESKARDHHERTMKEGFTQFNNMSLAHGDDLLQAVMTVDEAKQKCYELAGCKGFSHMGEPTDSPVLIWFTGSWAPVLCQSIHTSYRVNAQSIHGQGHLLLPGHFSG